MTDETALPPDHALAASLAAAGVTDTMLANARAAAERLCAGTREPAPGPLQPTGPADYQSLMGRLARGPRR